MLRTMLCVAVGLFACADLAQAKDKKVKPVIGVIKAVDAAKGTVTVTTKKNHVATDQDFTVTDTTKITIAKADGTTKDLTGKDGLKDPVVNVGASIKVTTAADGTVTEVAVGGNYKKPKKPA